MYAAFVLKRSTGLKYTCSTERNSRHCFRDDLGRKSLKSISSIRSVILKGREIILYVLKLNEYSLDFNDF